MIAPDKESHSLPLFTKGIPLFFNSITYLYFFAEYHDLMILFQEFMSPNGLDQIFNLKKTTVVSHLEINSPFRVNN